MSVLTKTQKIFSGIKLIGNFLEKPLRLGDVVLNDDGQHILWGNIEELIEGLSLEGKTITGQKEDLKYTHESSVDVTLGGALNSPLASGEIQLNFNAENSAFVSLNQAEVCSLKLGLIDQQLKNYWKKQGFDGILTRRKYHLIAEVIQARSGTVIFSQDKDNTVVLKCKDNLPATSMAVIGNGQVEFASGSKSSLQLISETPIQPLYTAVRYRASGNFEVIG